MCGKKVNKIQMENEKICPELLKLINSGIDNIFKQITKPYQGTNTMGEKKLYRAQCVLRAMIENMEDKKIFPIAVYQDKPEVYKTNKITGFPLTEKSDFGITVMNTISERRRIFTYNGIQYEILSAHLFNTTGKETDKKNPALFSSQSKVPIYICSQINCEKLDHDVEEMIGHAKNKLTQKEVSFTVAYCYNCDKFYALEAVVDQLLSYNILIDACLYPDNGDGSSFYGYDERSLLRANGYTVSKNSHLTTEMRQNILANIIDNGIIKRHQIIYHLRGLIELRSLQYTKDFSSAIRKWKEDIDFVSKYETPEQLDVYGEIML